MVSVAVEGPLGEPVFYAANSLTGASISSLTPRGTIVCVLPRCPLLPGRYSLTFYIEVSGRLADWVRSAMYFDVFESDAFGTGQLPPGAYGRMLIEQRWTSRDERS